MEKFDSHKVTGSTVGYRSQSGWRWRDAFGKEATVDGEVCHDVGHGAVHAVAPPALLCIPRHCRNMIIG